MIQHLLGTAPIFSLEPGDKTALFAFIVPTLESRSTFRWPCAPATTTVSDSRSEITQSTPLAGAELMFWGFPAERRVMTPNAFPKGSPGSPANCPGLADTSCIAKPTEPSHSGVHPLTDNPTDLHR